MNTAKSTEDKPTEFCKVCHVGSSQPHRVTYARWHSGEFILMPGMPAWRCDFCGDTFYDHGALAQLALLLGPDDDMEDQQQWRATGLEEMQKPEFGDRRLI